MPDPVTDTPARTRPETVIGGRYKTLRVVGRGGMGTVYEAVHTWTGRRVALKTLLPHAVADERAVERFRREARAGVQGAHRHIVEVLDMGVDPADGTLFLAQEFLTGEDLAARLARDGRLPLRDAYELLIPAMAALDVAHRAGVVHRDVKPANLFLSGSAEAIVPKVIDFGIAAIADAEAVTRTGAPLGTPQYMAPEQAYGARDLDLRVDVWSMGAVWFEALTGRRPIDGASYHEVMARLLAGSPPRVESVAPELPAEVRAAIDGLEPDRSRRHASMAAFARALLRATTVASEPWLRALADEHRFAEAPAVAPARRGSARRRAGHPRPPAVVVRGPRGAGGSGRRAADAAVVAPPPLVAVGRGRAPRGRPRRHGRVAVARSPASPVGRRSGARRAGRPPPRARRVAPGDPTRRGHRGAGRRRRGRRGHAPPPRARAPADDPARRGARARHQRRSGARTMKPSRLALLSLALCFGPASAVAQPAPVDPVEEHLRRGVELRRAGRPDAALAEFDAAYARRRDPRTAAQLGLACQADGRWLRADGLLREALGVPGDPWIARNRAALEGALAVVGRHLATVDLVGDVPGARVQVNGADVGALPLAAPVRVVAGTVTVVATADGFDPLTLRFVASAGESLRERVSLLPARVAPPPVVAPPAPAPAVVTPAVVTPAVVAPAVVAPTAPAPRGPWRSLAIGAFVGAGVLVGGGVAALVVGDDAAGDYNRQCDSGDARGDCGAVRDRAVAAGAITWTTLPLAALLSAAGTVFVVRDRAEPLRRAARVTCGAGPTSVRCAFTF